MRFLKLVRFVPLMLPVCLSLLMLAPYRGTALAGQPSLASGVAEGDSGPDLIVEDMYSAQDMTNYCTVEAGLVVVVRNIGTAAAGPSETEVYGGWSGAAYLATPGLAPGEAAHLLTQQAPLLSTYVAVADWNDKVPEADETNNSLSKEVQVITLPTCTPTPTPTFTLTPTPTPTPIARGLSVVDRIEVGWNGWGPSGLAADPGRGLVYVAGTTSILLIDTSTNAIVDSIPMGRISTGIAVNTALDRIYVTSTYNDSLTVIDGASRTVITTINVGDSPNALAVNSATNRVYVPSKNDNAVWVIDGDTNSVTTTIAISQPRAIAANGDTNRIYAVNGTNEISVIDGSTDTLTAPISIGDDVAAFVDVNPTNNRIYVGDDYHDRVLAIDGASNSVTASVDLWKEDWLGYGPIAIAVNPQTDHVYATFKMDGDTYCIGDVFASGSCWFPTIKYADVGVITTDPATNQVYVGMPNSAGIVVKNGAAMYDAPTTIMLRSSPTYLAVNPTTHRLYVVNTVTNSLTTIDTATDHVVSSLLLGGRAHGIAVNPNTNRIYLAMCDANQVRVLDGGDLHVITNVPVGSFPNDVAVNPNSNTIYAADDGDDTVSAINGATNSVIKSIPVNDGPYAVAVNPVTNRVYVATNGIDHKASVIDGATNAVIDTISIPYSQDVAVNPETNRVYFANNTNGADVSVVSGDSDAVLQTIPLSLADYVAVNPTTNRIYVDTGYPSQLIAIDGYTNIAVASVPVSHPEGIVVDSSSGRIYLAELSGDTIAVITDLPPVGGLAEPSDAAGSTGVDAGLSGSLALLIGAAGIVVFASGGWYARRRLGRQRR